jgi:hypothetical protein
MTNVTDVPKYSQAELCDVVGLDATTANNWVLRGVIRPGKVEGREIARVRLFSELEVFRAKFIFELVYSLGITPSKAADIRTDQAARWVKTADRCMRDHQETYAFLYHRKPQGWKFTIARRQKNSETIFSAGDEPPAFPPTTFIALPISNLISDVRERLNSH